MLPALKLAHPAVIGVVGGQVTARERAVQLVVDGVGEFGP
jgi:hypothetical protein